MGTLFLALKLSLCHLVFEEQCARFFNACPSNRFLFATSSSPPGHDEQGVHDPTRRHLKSDKDAQPLGGHTQLR